ncbi:MAG: hypothetical protein ACJ749_02395, partial [Flavisolibacter sp.]
GRFLTVNFIPLLCCMKTWLTGMLMLVFFISCNNDGEKAVPASENDLDAARNFIRAALDRKWEDAKRFMLKDSSNLEILNSFQDFYREEKGEERRNYREASITTYDSRKVNDSTTIVNYSNSYKKKMDSIKIVRRNGQWLVDLKYSFLPTDSSKNVQ